jgi:hypothetical protein
MWTVLRVSEDMLSVYAMTTILYMVHADSAMTTTLYMVHVDCVGRLWICGQCCASVWIYEHTNSVELLLTYELIYQSLAQEHDRSAPFMYVAHHVCVFILNTCVYDLCV